MKFLFIALSFFICAFSSTLYRGRAHDAHFSDSSFSAPLTAETGFRTYPYQQVDHFTPTDERLWTQRFLSLDRLVPSQFGVSKPFLIVSMGCEGPLSETELTADRFIFNKWIAQNPAGGAVVAPEHRFYGRSLPSVHPDDYDNENTVVDVSAAQLRYLTAEQSLADHVRLAQWYVEHDLGMKTTDFAVIAVGGSYCGNLAAWARVSYPHFFNHAVAYSAPTLAKTVYTEYFKHAHGQFAREPRATPTDVPTEGDTCADRVSASMSAMKRAIGAGKGTASYEMFTKMFQWKGVVDLSVGEENLTPEQLLDLDSFETKLTDFFGLIQYALPDGDYDPATGHWERGSVGQFCQNFKTPVNNEPTPETDAALILEFFNALSSDIAAYHGVDPSVGQTVNFANDMEDVVKDKFTMGEIIAENGIISGRSWVWQTCTEYGYYQPRYYAAFNNIGPRIEYFYETCKRAYGFTTNAPNDHEILVTNSLYGADRTVATDLIFSYGDIDPWTELRTAVMGTCPDHKCDRVENIRDYDSYDADHSHCYALYWKKAGAEVKSNAKIDEVKLQIEKTVLNWAKL